MKTKTYLKIALALLFFQFLFIPSLSFAAGGAFDYKLLEGIPGIFTKGQVVDLNAYISGIYKFAITIVGICALFMITVGGYMYLASAGNNATMGKAKSIITDAIIGLVLALLAYLIFNTINPALVNPTGLRSIGITNAPPIKGTITGSTPEIVASNTRDAVIRKELADNQIQINKGQCTTPGETNCTSLDGLQASTVNGLKELKTLAGTQTLTVTGGTEAGHATGGDHPKGTAVDIQATDPAVRAAVKKMVEEGKITKVCAPSNYADSRVGCNDPEAGMTSGLHIVFAT